MTYFDIALIALTGGFVFYASFNMKPGYMDKRSLLMYRSLGAVAIIGGLVALIFKLLF